MKLRLENPASTAGWQMPFLVESKTLLEAWGKNGRNQKLGGGRGDTAEGTEVELDDRRNIFKRLQLMTIYSFLKMQVGAEHSHKAICHGR